MVRSLAFLPCFLPLAQVSPDASERFRDYPETDVLAYDIELTLDPARKTVEGHEHIRIRAQQDLGSVPLDAVTKPGWTLGFRQGKELAFRRESDERVRVELETPVRAGQELELEARFSGAPPDGLYFGRTRYGEPCVFTDHYSIRAHGWLPCEDHPGDRARFSLALIVPRGLEVVGTGGMARTSEPAPDGFALWKGACASELPTYLLAFAVGSWARIAEDGDARLLPHFVYARDREKAERALVHHAQWMRRMEQVFGPYPYGSYCIAQVPTRWGGMENAGNTWVMEQLFDLEQGGVGTLAHEFAHQWFGDGVGYADWREVWLSEGFASYLGPWLEAETGGPPLAEAMARARENWLSSSEGRAYPVRWRGFEHPDGALNPNSYPKGAWVLHMLRKELGDEMFFSALAGYYRANVGHAVSTEALRAAVERAAGRELGWFFAQWLDRPGCPELRFEWKESGVTARQVQSGAPFEFLLPLRWTGADGQVRERDVHVRERETEIELEGAPIRDGQVDPRVELLYRNG